jgi:glycosyltransferase involved in cell wall biosynthesis
MGALQCYAGFWKNNFDMYSLDRNLTGVRILSALNSFELFGHERGNIESFKTLRDLGAEVLVGVDALPDNHVNEELQRLSFSTFTLPFESQWSVKRLKSNPSVALTNVWAVLRCSLSFLRAIRTFRPTHIHLGSPLVYSYVSLALGLSKVPLVYRMGDCPPVDSPFNLRIWRMTMRRCSRVVANSKFVLNSALAAGVSSKKILVIHNLAPSSVNSANPTGSFPDQDIPASLIYVGAVAAHKGLVPLVEAFSLLAPDFPFMRLDILGGSRYDTPFRNQLKEMIAARNLESRVLFHGHVDDPSAFFRRSAVHVAPSMWEEPFANVVLEAKREGTPSIVFPSGGLPEMVRHQMDGYICREKSVDALVEGLRWMLADRDRLQRMGEAAHQDSEKRFGRERFARAWADVYRSVN